MEIMYDRLGSKFEESLVVMNCVLVRAISLVVVKIPKVMADKRVPVTAESECRFELTSKRESWSSARNRKLDRPRGIASSPADWQFTSAEDLRYRIITT
jgi:hypothetical protein